jgi:micrococcal nuclease
VADVILPDGRNLNHEIVRAGLAWWFRRYAPDDEDLKRLEAQARQAKRGLWADAEPVPPWEWRTLLELISNTRLSIYELSKRLNFV